MCASFSRTNTKKELAEGIGAEEEECTEHPEIPPPMDFEEDMEGPDVKAELPAHLTIAKDVMERCIHLLSDLRLKVLDVLELCVCVLSEKENELLPMAHRCWPALLLRLTADCPPILQGTVHTGGNLLRFPEEEGVQTDCLSVQTGSSECQGRPSLQPRPGLQAAAGCAAGPGGSLPPPGPRGLRPGCCN